MKQVSVKILGSGNAFNQDSRLNSSYLISTSKEKVLFDCGFTTPYALQKNGVEFNEIDTIILSHYHGDHFAGISAVLLALKYVSIQKKQLRIVGPGNVEKRVNDLVSVVFPGSEDVMDDLNIEFISITAHQEMKLSSDYSIMPLEMVHSEEAEPHGYVFKFKQFSIGFSGDTCWHDGIEELLDLSDQLFLECNFEHKLGKGHLSVEELNSSVSVQKMKSSIYLTHLHKGSFDKAISYGYNCVKDGNQYDF